jgi:rapamycin-insensitive companion of mTOR
VRTIFSTCFFVLGLISSTPSGVEILEELGWESACTPVGSPTGLCFPTDLDAVTYVCVLVCVRSVLIV